MQSITIQNILLFHENERFYSLLVNESGYPSIPGHGNDVLKLNTFGTTDTGIGDFNYGNPEIVPFR
jgi:hypothetical protein